MITKIVAACLTLALVTSAFPRVALAQSETGQIRISVTDEDGKTPLSLARVVLDGPVVTSELTSAKGLVTFIDVPDGIYRARIAKSGHQSITSAPFEVVNGRSVTVNVTLALSTSLKIIGTVVAKSSASISTTSINQDSAQRKLSSDLADALNKLSGVSVNVSSDDTDAAQTISLEGHDASQTQLSLDGIPLNAPGSAGNLGSFATDLFGGASVRNGPQVGGLGGGVNFSTLQPTLSWMTQTSFSAGSDGRYNYSAAESGSLGKLGIALQNTFRQNTSLVDGMTYLDASGLDYSHDGDSSIAGDLARFRYQFSDSQTLTGTFLGSNRTADLACLRFTGSVPCGYGPGNTSTGNVQLYSLADNALVGETSIVASVYGSTFNNVNDQLDRFVNGVAQPIGFSSDTHSRGYTLSAQLPAKERHTISIQSSGSWSDSATTPLVAAAKPYYNATTSSDYATVQITDTVHANDKLTLTESLGGSRATGGFSSALGSANLAWKPTSKDVFTGSLSVGGVAATPSRTTILSDPASLRFDCKGNVAYGDAPGDSPTPSSSTSERIGYTRSLGGGSLTFQLYNQVQNGSVLPVEVNGSVLLASGTITPAYLAAVQAIYQSPAGCGASAPLTATQLYFTAPVAGVQRVYQGGSISGFVRAGNLVVQPFYNLTVAKINSNDVRINNPYSITVAGQQLPNVPQQRAGLVLDYKAPNSSVEWLADAQYTGKNNPNNLPAYTQFDAGVSAAVYHGTLTLAVSNITNTYAGTFAGPTNAVPYFTQNGVAIPTTARPLAPRSVSVTWSAKFGPGSHGASAPLAALAQGGAARFGPLPETAPAHPLDIAATCPAESADMANAISSTLRDFVARIEKAKTATGYPASMDAPTLKGAVITYHGMGSTYALTIAPTILGIASTPLGLASQHIQAPPTQTGPGGQNRGFGGGGGGGALRAYFGCFALHVAQPDDVKAKHLFSSGQTLFRVPTLNFMPSVGLYIEGRAPQAGREQFRVYALPSTPPADPFQVRAAESCTDDLKSSATAALGELRAYFANPSTAKTTLWTIGEHVAPSGKWYDLAPGDPSIIAALLNCGRVANATPADIVKLGWDGASVPRLNYAPALGIYVIRPPQPNPSSSPRPTGP